MIIKNKFAGTFESAPELSFFDLKFNDSVELAEGTIPLGPVGDLSYVRIDTLERIAPGAFYLCK